MEPLLQFGRRYGVRYVPWYLAGTVMLAATNWLSVTIPLYLAQGIDALSSGEAGRATALAAAGTVAGMGAVTIAVRTASRLLFFTPGRLVEAAVKRDLYTAVLRQQPAFLAAHPVGDLMSRMSSDVQNVRLLFGFTLLGVVNTAVAVTLTAIQMARLSPLLAGIAAAPLLLAFLVTLGFVDRLRAVTREIQEASGALSEQALAGFQGIATVHAFGAIAPVRARFDVDNRRAGQGMIRRGNLRVGIGPLLGLAGAVNVFLLMWFGGPRVLAGDLTVGELIAFTTLVGYLAGPLRGMTFILSLFKQSQASLERIDQILAPAPHRPDLPSPAPAPTRPPAIELRDLTFRYPDADRDALHRVSVSVPAGGTLGLFGPTGSGKTTLLRCLLRLADPPSGSILVDGVDVRALDLDAWRRAAVLVPQRAFLFSESLADNVLLGDRDRAKLDGLLDRAQLRVDLASLPDGVETGVGEAGLNLSGGQRQRVALARGLARDATVLALDDVLSAVDHHTEAALLRALRERPGRPTTVIAANRISALRHADVILVLDATGHPVDHGDHEALMSRPGPYRDAALRQQEAGE